MLIEQHVIQNKSCEQIAKEFGFTPSGVRLAIKRFGIKYTKHNSGTNIINRVGKIYGKYEVKNFVEKVKTKTFWLCKCECGKENIVSGDGLNKQAKRNNGCISCCVKQSYNYQTGKKTFKYQMVGEIHLRYLNNLRLKAIRRKKEYNLDNYYLWQLFLKQNRKCVLSGLDLCFSSNYKNCHIQTASLDRIDSSKGYIEGNVQWVHKKVNFMKQSLSDSEFISLCKIIAENN